MLKPELLRDHIPEAPCSSMCHISKKTLHVAAVPLPSSQLWTKQATQWAALSQADTGMTRSWQAESKAGRTVCRNT